MIACVHDAKPSAISSTFASVKLSTRAAHALDAHAPSPGVRESYGPHTEKSLAASAPAHESRGGGDVSSGGSDVAQKRWAVPL